MPTQWQRSRRSQKVDPARRRQSPKTSSHQNPGLCRIVELVLLLSVSFLVRNPKAWCPGQGCRTHPRTPPRRAKTRAKCLSRIIIRGILSKIIRWRSRRRQNSASVKFDRSVPVTMALAERAICTGVPHPAAAPMKNIRQRAPRRTDLFRQSVRHRTDLITLVPPAS